MAPPRLSHGRLGPHVKLHCQCVGAIVIVKVSQEFRDSWERDVDMISLIVDYIVLKQLYSKGLKGLTSNRFKKGSGTRGSHTYFL
jgi:hypothetical protein